MACVMRAVETMPVSLPISVMISLIEVTVLPGRVEQSPRFTASVTPMMPAFVLIPAIMAVPVPALSGVWALTLYVLTSARFGNASCGWTYSSPKPPSCWPANRREA